MKAKLLFMWSSSTLGISSLSGNTAMPKAFDWRGEPAPMRFALVNAGPDGPEMTDAGPEVGSAKLSMLIPC